MQNKLSDGIYLFYVNVLVSSYLGNRALCALTLSTRMLAYIIMNISKRKTDITKYTIDSLIL